MGKGRAPTFDAASAQASATAAANSAQNRNNQMNAAGNNATNAFGSMTTQVSTGRGDPSGLPRGAAIGVTQTLNPTLQGAANVGQQALGAQFGLLPQQAFNPNTNGQQIRNAYIQQATAPLQSEWQRQDNALQAQIADRGLPIGSNAYNNAMAPVNEQRSNQLRAIGGQAYLAGTGEEQRQFGNQLTQYQLPGQMAAQNVGLLQNVQNLAPAIRYPNVSQISPDAAAGQAMQAQQMQYQSQLQQYNQRQQQLGQALQMGLGLLSAPLTGGTSLLGMGMGALGGALGGMFNGGGGAGGSMIGNASSLPAGTTDASLPWAMPNYNSYAGYTQTTPYGY